MLGWSQLDLAVRAGLSLPTVKRLEGGFGPRVSVLEAAVQWRTPVPDRIRAFARIAFDRALIDVFCRHLAFLRCVHQSDFPVFAC